MGRMTRINIQSPSDMAEEIQTEKSGSSAPSGRSASAGSASDTPLTDKAEPAHFMQHCVTKDFARNLERENERRKQFIFHLARKLQIVIGLNTSECEFLRSIGADVEMDSQNDKADPQNGRRETQPKE